jgi:signal transduction histidine kinase
LKNDLKIFFTRICDHFKYPSAFYDDKGELIYNNEIADNYINSLKNNSLSGIIFNINGNIINPEMIDKINSDILKEDSASEFEFVLCSEKYVIDLSTVYALFFKDKEITDEKYFDKTTSTFLANVSHEIRTPLNGIIGFAELIMKKNLSPEKIKDYSKIIYTNGSYLLKLITDMLDISRIEAGKLKLFKSQFSINRLLYDIQLFFLLDMKNRNKGHIMLKTSIGLPDGSDLIIADELRIKEVIINLIANSIKFTDQGSITIGYKTLSDSELEFFIKDTGMGMKQEVLNNIFHRFSQANDRISFDFGGTGLGLSISKEFVEMHGGKIWVESEEKKGTTFFFTLPNINSN